MSLRFHDSNIKSLLHFDHPHFGDTGDGLADSIGLFSYSRNGNARLTSSQTPADLITNNTPKFGYRCLHTEGNSDFITGTGSSLTLPQIEASMWVRPTSSTAGNLLILKNADTVILSLVLDASGRLCLNSSPLALNFTGTDTLALNTWHYVRVQVSTAAANISVNNSAGTSSAVNAGTLPEFNTIQLGGIHGQIDEFTLRSAFTSGLPAEPVKGSISLNDFGGFGSGALGNVTLNANCVINTYGLLYSAQNLDTATVYTGKFGEFKVGDEVLLHETGYCGYCFRTITGISGNVITFDRPPQHSINPQFGFNNCVMIQVPHFNTLTVNAGVTVSPPLTNSEMSTLTHGLVVFRVKGDCTINGSVITSGKGRERESPAWEASSQMTAKGVNHSTLPDYFVTGTGGGIFIACGGTLTAPAAARLGAPWSGAGTGGSPNGGLNSGGGAGYGGGSSNGASGQAGHAGWGGCSAGTQSLGSAPGRKSLIPLEDFSTSNTVETLGQPSAGSSIIIITRKLRVDEAAISTGGENAPVNSSPEAHGAGAGYCYIAAKELL